MKKYYLPIVMASLLLAGCSSAYQTAQTPDDVYFSTNPAATPALVKENRNTDNNYQNYFENDESYLRMKVRNGGRWSGLDDRDYWYGYNNGCQCNNNWGYYNNFNSFSGPFALNSYGYGGNYNPWSAYNPFSLYNPWSLNSFYNPYNSFNRGYGYGNVIIIGNKNPVYSNSSRPMLSGYNNNQYDRNGNLRRSSEPTRQQYRSIFNSNISNNNNSNSNTNDRPTRTFDNSSGSGNSNSGGSSRSTGGSSSSGRGGRGG